MLKFYENFTENDIADRKYENWEQVIAVYGLPWWLSSTESAHAGDAGAIPGSDRAPGGGNGTTLQYSCLGNPMDRGAWGLPSMEWQKSQT